MVVGYSLSWTGYLFWWIQLPWFPKGMSYSEMCLQWNMVVVFIILHRIFVSFGENNYHDSLQPIILESPRRVAPYHYPQKIYYLPFRAEEHTEPGKRRSNKIFLLLYKVKKKTSGEGKLRHRYTFKGAPATYFHLAELTLQVTCG